MSLKFGGLLTETLTAHEDIFWKKDFALAPRADLQRRKFVAAIKMLRSVCQPILKVRDGIRVDNAAQPNKAVKLYLKRVICDKYMTLG